MPQRQLWPVFQNHITLISSLSPPLMPPTGLSLSSALLLGWWDGLTLMAKPSYVKLKLSAALVLSSQLSLLYAFSWVGRAFMNGRK